MDIEVPRGSVLTTKHGDRYAFEGVSDLPPVTGTHRILVTPLDWESEAKHILPSVFGCYTVNGKLYRREAK